MPALRLTARSTLSVVVVLALLLGTSGCGRQPPPTGSASAPEAAPSTPKAAGPVERIADGPDKLMHGRYLVETVAGCGNCHTPRLPDGTPDPNKKFAGAFLIKEPVFEVYAKNITPDKETGIGSWSEGDIVNAIRNGKRPDGTNLGPPMPFLWYRHLSDTDVHAIAAYIKSVPAVQNKVPKSTYQIPLGNHGPTVTSVPDMPKTNQVKYGEYLAGPVAHCMDCHTTYVDGQIDMTRLGHGGNAYVKPMIYDWAAVSSNITSDKNLGLGNWTDDEIKRAITTGVSRDGRFLLPIMASPLYAKMEPDDLDAIVAYLRTLPP